MTKYYWVDAISTHKISYLIECPDDQSFSNGQIQDQIDDGMLTEADQEWMGERIVGVREIPEDEVRTKIDKIVAHRKTLVEEMMASREIEPDHVD